MGFWNWLCPPTVPRGPQRTAVVVGKYNCCIELPVEQIGDDLYVPGVFQNAMQLEKMSNGTKMLLNPDGTISEPMRLSWRKGHGWAMLAALLVLLAGCQTPREFKAEAHVAGQFVKCEVRR